jgi:hypothetical protein
MQICLQPTENEAVKSGGKMVPSPQRLEPRKHGYTLAGDEPRIYL